MNTAAKQTPLHAAHVAAGARMVDFAGWDMPVNYGSQIEEHHAVRRDAGMFDVSHMLALDLAGPDATAWLRGLLANDVAKLKDSGKALYACMLNERGGVADDRSSTASATRTIASWLTPARPTRTWPGCASASPPPAPT